MPWVAVSNMSNVYGEIPRPFNQSSPGLPFLGLFNSAEGCQAACEARSNCTQYSWALDVPQFELHCFGRCDDIWRLHPVPNQDTVVAARRVPAGPDNGSGSSTSLMPAQEPRATREEAIPKLRYGCTPADEKNLAKCELAFLACSCISCCRARRFVSPRHARIFDFPIAELAPQDERIHISRGAVRFVDRHQDRLLE